MHLALALLVLQSKSPIGPKAPELLGSTWINSDGKGLSFAARKGSPTIVHYWTFACSNCKANLPAYDRIYAKYAPKGVEMIGVHTPELDSERKLENVKKAVQKYGIKYPVLVDGEGKNWDRWQQEYWPSIYLIGKDGRLRYSWIGEFGEDGEKRFSEAIDKALAEK